MIAARCPNGHVYSEHAPVVADLTTGQTAISLCATCGVKTYTELSDGKARELLDGCGVRLVGLALMAERSRHARDTHGPLTDPAIAVWAASLDAVRNPYEAWTEPTDV